MKKILVIDDDIGICRYISKVLNMYNVITTTSAKEALKLLNSEKPNLIITDIVMPEMMGTEFISVLRKTNKSIPIIVITGHPIGKELTNTALSLGAISQLKKPFDINELKNLVARVLSFSVPPPRY